MGNLVKFWREFLAAPRAIGSVAPSSPSLTRRMVEWVDWEEARSVVECGPGTGPLTARILPHLREDAKFFAVEINPSLVTVFRERFPGVTVVKDTARNLRRICDRQGMSAADCILTSLPWAAFSLDSQRGLVEAMMEVLRPGGQFVTFAYLQGLILPTGKRFRQLLPHYFSEVSWSRPAWLNLPPALVYRCRR